MYACMHACMHVCMHVCMYVCMYACMYVCNVCMYFCMHVCMYACMYLCSGSPAAVAAILLNASSAHLALVFGFQAACYRSRGRAVAGASWHLFVCSHAVDFQAACKRSR